MTGIFLGRAGFAGKKYNREDAIHICGVRRCKNARRVRDSIDKGQVELVASAKVAKEIGRIAQLGERCFYKAEVTGSIPVPPTSANAGLRGAGQIIEQK
jgi:hypothetical protein